MARSQFGATLADFVVQPTDGLWGVAPGAALTFWSAADGGSQYTDLIDASGAAATTITADEYGSIPSFQGPDSVTGMWADAGGTKRAWIQARDAATGGGGQRAFTSLFRVVASATAPADVRSAAAYVCDGVADEVTIQQAITDAQSDGGGVVWLSTGGFNLSAPIVIAGTANEDNPLTVTLMGCGEHATVLKPAINTQAAILLTNWAQCHVANLGIEIMGATSGIVSTSVTTTDTRSFWDSSFRDLRVYGFYEPTYTGWAFDLDMPFRSVFDNIEVEGCRNGVHLYNNSPVQNAGDCVFSRWFIEIVGANGVAIHVESVDGNMNQNNFSMVEAGAGNGRSNNTGILIDGAAGGASQRFWGTNLEQFSTLVHVAHGESNVFDLNYVTCNGDTPTGNKAFVCGSDSYGNTFSSKWVNVPAGQTLQIIEDTNTTSNVPNVFERIRIENNGGTVTYSKSTSTVFREITTFNDGGTIQAGLLQYPLSTVNDPSPTPAKHNLITWTQDPRTLRSTGDSTTAGVLYLAKVDIANRATVVSNILVGVVTAGATLTAGQNVVGLYNSSGTLLATSADQSTAWTSTGLKTAAITPQTLAVGSYYVAILANGTTRPVFATGGGHGQDSITNVGLTTANAAFLTLGSGLTALPSTITLGSGSPNSGSRWAALS
ncbi:hypothetical protein ACGF7W_19495 [Streptomyces sp. NPDC048219]|uniref:hypothetical protein n=1 Tax=Streptomyces sp. NPDC048219 TaxID=3365517 RepID=UPI0037246965